MSGPWKCHQCNDGGGILREVCAHCNHPKCALCQHLELVHQSRLDDDGMLRGSSIFGNDSNIMQLSGDMEIDENSLRSVIESLSENQAFRRFVLDTLPSRCAISAGVPVGSSGTFEENTSAYGQSASQTGVEWLKEQNQPRESISPPAEYPRAYNLLGHLSGGTAGQGKYTGAAESPQQ